MSQEELRTARVALSAGEVAHAAEHLAAALHSDPDLDVGGDVAALLRVADDSALALVPVESPMPLGRAVLRAVILQQLRRWDEAVVLLLSLQIASPEQPMLSWLSRWLPDASVSAALDVEQFSQLCARCLESSPEAAKSLASTMQLVAEHAPSHGPLTALTARALRLAMRTGDALIFVQRQHARAPSHASAIALGTALRHANQLELAVDAFRAASKVEPNDASALLDLGDSLLELGRLDEAAEVFRTALQLEPGNQWPLASLQFLDALNGDAEAEKRLQTAARSGPDSRASALYGRLFPFTHQLACPNSGIVNAVINAIAKGTSLKTILLRSIEPPSAVLALRWTERNLGWSGAKLQLQLSGPSNPWRALEEVNDPLWTYDRPGADGIAPEAVAALQPPSAEVSAIVGRLAARTFSLESWITEAQTLARDWRFGAHSLLSAIAHPQPVGKLVPWAAIFRSQVAAALVLAFLTNEKERQDALRSLLYGPVDWSTSAGIVALTAVARADRTRAVASIKMMVDLFVRERMPIRYQCIHAVLVPCLLEISGVPAVLRTELLKLRRAMHIASSA